MKTTSLILASVLCAGSSFSQDAVPATPAAIEKWRNARFGMFIHWGPVSLTGKEIGWSRGQETPIEEYDNLYKQFNPTKFNADEWVAIAKAAGMKYMVLTTKHHDGFCLWDTKETDYNIMNTPFKRDVVKELAEACKKGGISFGTYYSTCDWHHLDFPLTSPGGKVERKNHNIDRYTEYLKAQTRELLSYGPLFTLWYDVPQRFDAARGASIIDLARAIQPDIVINNRTGHPGDYDTPEQRIGGFQIDRPWETCMTVCKQWAWKPDDKMKSLNECLHTLLRTAGGDGNLLFNVGPMPDGRIEDRQIERLKEMGAWLTRNGEAIYGTRGGPWKPTARLVSTRRDNKIYLHLLEKTAGPVRIAAPPVAIKSATLLHGPAIAIDIVDDDILSFDIPLDSWDGIATIVELTIDGDAMDIAPLRAATEPNFPGAVITASAVHGNDPQYAAGMAADGDLETRWATPAGTRQSWLQIDFPGETTFIGIEIEEALAGHSSRVLKFELQKKNGSDWSSFHGGTGLGSHFKAAFAPVTTTAIRINILDASEGPTISEIRLIKQP